MTAILAAFCILIGREWVIDNQRDLTSLKGGKYDLRWGRYRRRLRLKDNRSIAKLRARVLVLLQLPLACFTIGFLGLIYNYYERFVYEVLVIMLLPLLAFVWIEKRTKKDGVVTPFSSMLSVLSCCRRRDVQNPGRGGRKRFRQLNFKLTWWKVVREQGVDAEPAEEVLMAWAIVEMMTSGNRNARITAFRNLTGLRDRLALDLLHHGDSELPSLAIWTSDFVPLFHLIIVTGSLSWLFDPFKPRAAQGDVDGVRGVEPAPNRYPPEAREQPAEELALREFARSAQKALLYQWSQGDASGSDPEAREAAISGCFLVHWCTIPQVPLNNPLVGLGGTLDLAMSLLKSPEVSPRAVGLALCGLKEMVGSRAEAGTRLALTRRMLQQLKIKYIKERRYV